MQETIRELRSLFVNNGVFQTENPDWNSEFTEESAKDLFDEVCSLLRDTYAEGKAEGIKETKSAISQNLSELATLPERVAALEAESESRYTSELERRDRGG